jgi:transposase-like protein
MAINPIQMQPGLSLTEFMAQYDTETKCEAALYNARWPQGFRCPACQCASATEFLRKQTRYWHCQQCSHQTSLTAGTMMHQTQLPLTKWFLAMYLVTQSKTNIAALALRRQLGISWKAAWLLKHKLMEAMRQREEEKPLSGDVRVDDGYLGGERTGGKAGRGSENKTAFVAAVEIYDGRPQRVRFDPVTGFSFKALANWAATALMPGTVVTTDGLLGFEVLQHLGYSHQVVISPKGKAGTEIDAFKWLNTIMGNLKTAITGTHHAFKFAKYAGRYLAEVQYRFNRRANLRTIIPRLLVAISVTKPCPRGRQVKAFEQET